MSNKIELTREKRQDMIAEIKNYFQNERDEEWGNLASSLLLDFFIEKLAPEFYNQGVYDAYKFMNMRLEDIFEILK